MNETLLAHLIELRRRLFWVGVFFIIASVSCYFLFNDLISFVYVPFQAISQAPTSLYVTSLSEGFFTRLKFSIVGGAVFSSPVMLFHALRFIFPGLKPKERLILGVALFSSVLLSLLSLFLTYKFLLPYSIKFLTGPAFIPETVGILLNYHDNVFYVLNVILYSMLAFQFPIVLELALAMNWITRKSLYKATRYVIVSIFIIAAIVTPPDIVSQTGVALPLILLYFLTLLVAKIFGFGEEIESKKDS